MVRKMAAGALLAGLLLCFIMPVLVQGSSVPNARPLSGLRGYRLSPLLIANKAGATPLDETTLRAAIETRLASAGLLAELAPDVAELHVSVFVMPEEQGLSGWWAVMQVREPARLDRQPEAGTVRAVTWYRYAWSLTERELIERSARDALAGLTNGLIEKHGSGGDSLL
jgi:hypothetical protein